MSYCHASNLGLLMRKFVVLFRGHNSGGKGNCRFTKQHLLQFRTHFAVCSVLYGQNNMATVSVRRSRSGPQAQRNSTDVIVVRPTPASAAFVKRERFSFGRAAMHRGSGPVGIHLDNAEWEKKVMNSWPKKCTFVVREILQTERAYIASLEEIILVRQLVLRSCIVCSLSLLCSQSAERWRGDCQHSLKSS